MSTKPTDATPSERFYKLIAAGQDNRLTPEEAFRMVALAYLDERHAAGQGERLGGQSASEFVQEQIAKRRAASERFAVGAAPTDDSPRCHHCGLHGEPLVEGGPRRLYARGPWLYCERCYTIHFGAPVSRVEGAAGHALDTNSAPECSGCGRTNGTHRFGCKEGAAEARPEELLFCDYGCGRSIAKGTATRMQCAECIRKNLYQPLPLWPVLMGQLRYFGDSHPDRQKMLDLAEDFEDCGVAIERELANRKEQLTAAQSALEQANEDKLELEASCEARSAEFQGACAELTELRARLRQANARVVEVEAELERSKARAEDYKRTLETEKRGSGSALAEANARAEKLEGELRKSEACVLGMSGAIRRSMATRQWEKLDDAKPYMTGESTEPTRSNMVGTGDVRFAKGTLDR